MDTAKGKAVENGRGCKDLNLYLDVISANIFRIQRDIELEGLEFPLMLSLIATWGKTVPNVIPWSRYL